MRLFESRIAGDLVARGTHRGHEFEVIVGNDITGTNILGFKKRYRSLITKTKVGEEVKYACHVIVAPLFRKSRITAPRIKEAVESWKEKLDELLEIKNNE